jgi:hypothetical protein
LCRQLEIVDGRKKIRLHNGKGYASVHDSALLTALEMIASLNAASPV